MALTVCAMAVGLATLRPARAASPSSTAPTFAHDIAPLVYAHCTACHREGEAAPFALTTYEQVRKHAARIAEVTGRRIMPPWKAGQEHGRFIGDRRLGEAEIDLLRRWMDQGCTQGNLAEAPEPPHFSDGWQLGTPDLVVKMPEAYELSADGRDVYRCFAIPIDLPAGRYLRAVEFRPSNRKIVHHAVLTALPREMVRRKTAAEPAGSGPGFASGLAAPGERLPGPLGIWVPGKDPLPLPEGCAMRFPKGCDLIVQLHLHPDGKAEHEQSSVGLYLTDEPPKRQVAAVVLFNKNVDIAPGTADYKLTESSTLKAPAYVIGLFPHMHLLGRTVKATATLPDGTIRQLLSIDDWDFNWQGYYQFATPPRLPAGTRVDAEWTFDNSADNLANPNTPPRRVRFGEQTTDEMGVLILDVVPVPPVHPVHLGTH